MSTAIQAVILDIGNVLLGWQPEDFYDREIGSDRRVRLFSEVPLDEMNLRVDAGENFTDTIYGVAAEHPEWGDEIRMWHDRWLELAGPVMDHSVRLMRALRSKGVPVHALTNFGVDSFALACSHPPFGFLNEFDIPFVSGRMRMLKPNAEIYEAVEAKLGLPTESLFFTDDRPANVTAAAARGWQVHQFEGADGLAAALVGHGLLTEGEAA